MQTKNVEDLEFDDGLELDQEEMRDLDEGYRATTVPNDKILQKNILSPKILSIKQILEESPQASPEDIQVLNNEMTTRPKTSYFHIKMNKIKRGM
jgi:hypothetical protein